MIFIINAQIMDFKDSSILVKTFIDKTLRTKKGSPGISFILTKMLSLPPLTTLLVKNYTIQEILSLAYMVFFLFEGDDMVSAEWKSKNDIYIVDVTEVGDVATPDVDCDDCYGEGRVNCLECDTEGETDCDECTGEGTDSEGKECDMCDGDGSETCFSCDGTGYNECQTCGGLGALVSSELVYFNRELWVISNPDTIQSIVDSSEKSKDTFNDNLYDILDTHKGGFYLAGTTSEIKSEPLDEFELNYGDYSELHNQTMVSQIVNLRDLDKNKLPNMRVRIVDKAIRII